jgi:hypothetical protein
VLLSSLFSYDRALADFHCVRIHAVMGGLSGNNDVQYVELRMRSAGQGNLVGHTILFYDAANTLTATFTFPSGVSTASAGDSILIATTEFDALATGGVSDFTFAGNTTGSGDPDHPIHLNGRVVFEPNPAFTCGYPAPVDAIAYGTGTGGFGTPAVALPSTTQALRLRSDMGHILNENPSDNSAQYSLQPVSATTLSIATPNLATEFATPRNNANVVLGLVPPPSVGGIAAQPDLTAAAPAAVNSDRDHAPYILSAAIMFVVIAGGAIVWRRLHA